MIPNYGLYPQQQQRLNYLESQMAAQLRGRPVTSFEEVRAIPIDFDGTTFYFPNISNSRIYTKQIGLNGQAILKSYQLTELPQTQNAQDYICREEFTQAISNLSAQLTSIRQGVTANDKQQSTESIF